MFSILVPCPSCGADCDTFEDESSTACVECGITFKYDDHPFIPEDVDDTPWTERWDEQRAWPDSEDPTDE